MVKSAGKPWRQILNLKQGCRTSSATVSKHFENAWLSVIFALQNPVRNFMSSNVSAAPEPVVPVHRGGSPNMPDPKPLRILHIINDLSIGGAEMMLYRLLSQKSRERFDPVVISLMDRGSLRERIEKLGIPVYTARMKPGLPDTGFDLAFGPFGATNKTRLDPGLALPRQFGGPDRRASLYRKKFPCSGAYIVPSTRSISKRS